MSVVMMVFALVPPGPDGRGHHPSGGLARDLSPSAFSLLGHLDGLRLPKPSPRDRRPLRAG